MAKNKKEMETLNDENLEKASGGGIKSSGARWDSGYNGLSPEKMKELLDGPGGIRRHPNFLKNGSKK